MADAKKCDICGKYYDHYNMANDAAKPNGIKYLNIDERSKYWEHGAIECCPKCMKSIQDHIAKLSGKEYDNRPVEHKCGTCKYLKNEPGSDTCRECQDIAEHPNWEPQE